MKTTRIISIIAFLICYACVFCVRAQSTNPTFISFFDLRNKSNYASSAVQYGNKYYLVGSSTINTEVKESFLVVHDKNGNPIVKQNFRLDSTNARRTSSSEVFVLNNNEIIISGTNSYQNQVDSSLSNYSPWLIKVDSVGNIIWQHLFLDSVQRLAHIGGPVLIRDGNDFVFIWCSINDNTGSSRININVIDGNGVVKNTKVFQPFAGLQKEFQIFRASQLNGGEILLVGRTTDWRLVKSDARAVVCLDTNFNLLWAKEIGEKERYQFYNGLVDEENGKITLIGNFSATDVFLQYNGFIEEIDLSDGSSNRYHRLPFSEPVILRNMVKTFDGKFIIGGEIGEDGLKDASTWVLDSNWNWLWQTSYSIPPVGPPILIEERISSFVKTPDGGYLLSGTVSDNSWPITTGHDGLLIKLDSNGCLVSGCNVVGINTDPEWKSEIRIYPNPADELLHIENAQHQTLLRVYSIQGTLVFAKELLAEKDEIQLSSFSPGVYILEFENEQGLRQQERLVVSK